MPKRNLRLLRFARALRSTPTPAEDILWEQIRGGQLGVHFRRQEPIGPYICDFVCKRHRLILEIDGDSHEDDQADAERDRELGVLGYRVIRFCNSEIYEQREAMVDYIWHQLHGDG